MAAPEERDYKKKYLLLNAYDNCWYAEDESEYMDVIKYKFPDDSGCTPFSNNPYFNHFIEASGLTYLGNYEDFKDPYSNMKVRTAIPMGYKSILIYERVCLYDKGTLVIKRDVANVRSKLDKYVGKYVVLVNRPQRYTIPSWGSNELVTYELKPNIDNKLYTDAFDDLNLAIETAGKFSIKENAKSIVCMIIEYVSWH